MNLIDVARVTAAEPRIAALESIVKQIADVSSIEARCARQDAARITTLEAKAEDRDIEILLERVDKLTELVIALEQANTTRIANMMQQRSVNEALLMLLENNHLERRGEAMNALREALK